MLGKFLRDPDQSVVQMTQKYLLVSIADWADSANILTHSNGPLNYLMNDISQTLYVIILSHTKC